MKKLIFLAVMFAAIAGVCSAQGFRIGDDHPVQSVQFSGGPIFSTIQPKITICNHPANAVPCTNVATTYTDATLGTPCATSTQLVLSGTNTCVGTADAYGNWGAWVAGGSNVYYDITITLPGGVSSGPITVGPLNTGGSGGSPGGSDSQIQYNNLGSFGGFTLGGDCSVTIPNIVCAKTNGVPFGALATVTPGTGVATLLGGTASGSGGPVGSTAPTITNPVLIGTPNAGGATQFQLPTASGFATASNGDIGYDTANKNWHVWQNGADAFAFSGPASATYTNGDCTKFGVAAGSVTLVDTGRPCANGSGTPGGADTQIQINKSGSFGAITGFGLNSSTSPTQFNVPFSFAPAGPRPYIDVTAPPYNADPTGATDSTAAIQAAITAACAISTAAGRPAVYFPPGRYTVTQTQTGTSATAPIFSACAGFYAYSNGASVDGPQFSNPPSGASINVTPGASPNGAAIFGFTSEPNWTIEGLTLNCYNQCISAYADTGIHITNDSETVQNTGLTDNTPLKLTNSFWIWVTGGTLQTPTGSMPTMELTGETAINGEAPLVGLLTVRDLVTAGGSFEYIQRVVCTSQAGTWSFHNITQEDTAMADLTIAESSAGLAGNACYPSGIVFNQVGQSDTTGGTSGNLMYEATQFSVVRNVSVIGSTGPIYLTGTVTPVLSNLTADGSNVAVHILQNGVPVGTQFLGDQESGGFDFISSPLNQAANTGPVNCSGFGSGCFHGVAAARFCMNGSAYCSISIDASEGIDFGLGGSNQQAFTAGLQQNASGDLDILTATLPAPTGLSGTATTGGSLAAGTYYGILWTTSNGSCYANSAFISSTVQAAGVVISGSNNAINFTWTAPAAGPASAADYCIQVTTSPSPIDQRVQQEFEFAAPATSLLFTGQSQFVFGTNSFAFANMTPVHRFTYNSLGVNTLSPAYNLDVNGTGRITGNVVLPGLTTSGTITEALCEDASGNVIMSNANCFGGSGGGATLQTNSVNNSSQATLNLLNSAATNGVTLTFTNTSGGNVQLGLTGTLNNSGLTNDAVTVNGQSCVLGTSCTVPFQTNGTGNASQVGLNVINGTFDGLNITATNPTSNEMQLGLSGALNNSGLLNSSTQVNGQTCTLGASCAVPFQTNSANNVSQSGLNMLTSTANSVGLTVTPTNSATNQEKFEITGLNYTGNAATASNLTGCTGISTAGSVCYWNGSAWTVFGGNSSGTSTFQENSSGVPSWGSGSSTAFEANGVALTSSSTVNFENSAATNGLTLTFTNPSAGNVELGVSGTLNNSGLTNDAVTVNGQSCVLGTSCTVPFQTNGTGNASQGGINFLTSTANATGLALTPSNPSTNGERFEATGTVNAASGGTGMSSPTAHTIPIAEGSSAFAFIGPGKTGQVLQANNGADPSIVSPGITDGNGGAAVTTTPYLIQCDSSTTLLDRGTIIRLQSGASAVNVPLSTGSGCPNLPIAIVDDGAGSVTVQRNSGSTDTFSIFNGTTNTDSATSFTLTSGQYATLTQGASGIWEVRIVGAGAVASVSNSDGTLTISPTTGSVVASLALGHANTWTALQTFGTDISIGGVTATGATGTGNVVFSASPALTGAPTAPTQTTGNNSTDIATTAYADNEGTIVGSGLTAGDVYYSNAGALTLAEANASSTLPAICVAVSTTACRYSGVYTTTGLTGGGIYYVSDATAGLLTTTAPTSSGHFVQRVGVAISTTQLLINPSLDVGGIQ